MENSYIELCVGWIQGASDAGQVDASKCEPRDGRAVTRLM